MALPIDSRLRGNDVIDLRPTLNLDEPKKYSRRLSNRRNAIRLGYEDSTEHHQLQL
jgi:hypothetical protein